MSTRNIRVGFEFEFLTYKTFKETRESISHVHGYDDSWIIESEGLEKDWNAQIPTEVKTSVFNGKVYGKRVIQSFLRYLRYCCSTNDSCSLHINLSSQENGWQWNLKRRKLIQESKQKYWLRYFGRSDNGYCSSQDLNHIKNDKFMAISFDDINRVEFRIIGGKHYQRKSAAILKAYDDFVNAFTNSLQKIQ